MRVLCFTILGLLAHSVWASEINHIMRSPKGLLMGDAYTTLADRQFALFYNPANLARHSGFSMWFFNPNVQVTNPIGETEKFENFPSEPNDVVSQFIGFPLHVSAGINPGFILGQFGFTAFNTSKSTLHIRNLNRPILDIQSTTDKGFITGGAFNLWESGDAHIAMGVALKYNKRKAVDEAYPIFGTTMLDLLDAGIDDYSDLINSLDSAQGRAWGYDFGLDMYFPSSLGNFSIGLAALDLFGTNFSSNKPDISVPAQEMNITLGTSWSFKSTLLDYTISLDLQHMNQKLELMRKVHLGFELGVPLVKAFAGYNAGYWSYGTKLGLGVFDLLVGFHSVELGEGVGHIENKRLVLYLSLLDFSFDA